MILELVLGIILGIGLSLMLDMGVAKFNLNASHYPFISRDHKAIKKLVGRWYFSKEEFMDGWILSYKPGGLIQYDPSAKPPPSDFQLQVKTTFLHRHYAPLGYAHVENGKCMYCLRQAPEQVEMLQNLQKLKGVR